MGALGKAPDADGNGLTMTEHQRIIWSQWASFGVISGGEVSGTSGWSYGTKPGAAVLEVSATSRQAVIVPIPETTVPTEPAPVSGSRVDHIIVDQNGKVTVGQTVPAGSFRLCSFRVPAGAASTSAATLGQHIVYAVPLAGSLGVLARWDETLGHEAAIPTGDTILKKGTFVLPTDRRLAIKVRHSVAANKYTAPVSSAPSGKMTGTLIYYITIDSTEHRLLFNHGEYWGTVSDEIDTWLTAGEHTYEIRRKLWSGGQAQALGGGASKLPQSYVRFVDAGGTK